MKSIELLFSNLVDFLENNLDISTLSCMYSAHHLPYRYSKDGLPPNPSHFLDKQRNVGEVSFRALQDALPFKNRFYLRCWPVPKVQGLIFSLLCLKAPLCFTLPYCAYTVKRVILKSNYPRQLELIKLYI